MSECHSCEVRSTEVRLNWHHLCDLCADLLWRLEVIGISEERTGRSVKPSSKVVFDMGGKRVLRQQLIAPIFYEEPRESNSGHSEVVLLVGTSVSSKTLSSIVSRVNAIQRHYSIAHPQLLKLYWRRFGARVGRPRPTGIKLGRYVLNPLTVARFSREDLQRLGAIPVTVVKKELIIVKKKGDEEWQPALEEMMLRMRAQRYRVVKVGESEYDRAMGATWGADVVFVR